MVQRIPLCAISAAGRTLAGLVAELADRAQLVLDAVDADIKGAITTAPPSSAAALAAWASSRLRRSRPCRGLHGRGGRQDRLRVARGVR
jgi:hypothetical protein